MKSLIKFPDNSEIFILKTSETATVEKGFDCGWGFKTKKGYNTWEAYPDGFKTKAEAKSYLAIYEKECLYDAKFE